jgi:hypothetical protein
MQVNEETKEVREGEKTRKRKVRSYHCAACNSFVVNETAEEQGGGDGDGG